LKDDNNENADDIPLDTDYGVDIDTELPNHLAESSGNRNEVLQISTVNSEGVKIGNDYNADGSEGIDDFEDVSVDTTIDFQIDSVVPVCAQCQKPCKIVSLIKTKNVCTDKSCSTLEAKNKEFHCKTCNYHACFQCAKSSLNSKEVERKVSVAKSMTKTVGNNGNHEVS